MSDSDDDYPPLKKIHLLKEFEEVPIDTEFELRFKPWNKPKGRFQFVVKKGIKLPYSVNLEGRNVYAIMIMSLISGFDIVFGQDLQPRMSSGWIVSAEKTPGIWTFKECEPVYVFGDKGPDISLTPLNQLNPIGTIEYSSVNTAPTQIEQVSICELSTEENLSVFDYVTGNDLDQTAVDGSDSVSTSSNAAIQDGFKAVPSTVHTNPGWKDQLQRDFQSLIVDKCSRLTVNAVKNNEDITDIRSKKLVRNEIINTVVDHLLNVYGGVGTPKLAVMRDVKSIMVLKYPNMFGDDHTDAISNRGYGLGGTTGNKNLPCHMIDRFKALRNKLDKTESVMTPDTSTEVKKKGKKADIYGVDNNKYYIEKIDDRACEIISQANSEVVAEKREEVYSNNREALHTQIRNSSKTLKRVCRGFFLHPIHVAKHFSWLSNVEDLNAIVDQNLTKQIDYLEMYLSHMDSSLDFKEKLEEINRVVETDYSGSRIYRDIHILRIAGSHFDSDGSSLIRFERELPSNSPAPFILAVESNRLDFLLDLITFYGNF